MRSDTEYGGIIAMFNDDDFTHAYKSWASDHIFEYERSPTEKELYDFYVAWLKEYNEAQLEYAAIDQMEREE